MVETHLSTGLSDFAGPSTVVLIGDINIYIYILIHITINLDLQTSVNFWLFACSYMFLANRAHFHIASRNCSNEHLLSFH